MSNIFNCFNVSGMPSLVFFKNGKEVINKLVGVSDINELENRINFCLNQ